MTVDTIRDLWAASTNCYFGQAEVSELARAVKAKADAAWDACSAARARGDDLAAEREVGRAHAFCEVMGDQSALSQTGAFGDVP